MTALLVVAKAPLPGRSKTRLCPPCSPEEAAALAEASLADTLASVASCGAARRVLALEGPPGAWLPPGFEVIPQRGGGLDERLAWAFADIGEPTVQIGMDTPQVTPRLLSEAMAALEAPRTDAVLGEAEDGGWWAIGLRRPDPAAFLGVPMSTPRTGTAQRRRLDALRLRVTSLPRLRDVDTYEDAVAVASSIPASRFARALASIGAGAPSP